MKATIEKMSEEVRQLPDIEKLALVEEILGQLDRPDPEVDKAWVEEVRQRRKAFQEGRMESHDYSDVMARYRRS